MPPRPGQPGPHPFACQGAELADLLCALPGPAGQAARKAVVDELTVQLPTASGAPAASPELIRPEPSGSRAGRPARVSLAPWRVPVLAFSPAGALDLLGAAGLLADVAAIAGGSLRYLAAVARFAVDLVERGRVLP